jgi:hypothetical protein
VRRTLQVKSTMHSFRAYVLRISQSTSDVATRAGLAPDKTQSDLDCSVAVSAIVADVKEARSRIISLRFESNGLMVHHDFAGYSSFGVASRA